MNLDINKSPIQDLKQYGMAIQEFFTFYTLIKKVASVWTTEEKKIMELCEYIIKNAENGQLDGCKQIIGKSKFSSKFYLKVATFQSQLNWVFLLISGSLSKL